MAKQTTMTGGEMTEQQWTHIDKSEWPEGPWKQEPDKIQWVDEATDLDCLIVRQEGRSGHLCGYVGVPPSHPAHGVDYSDRRLDGLSVHGGITYANSCDEDAEEGHGICHVPLPGREADVWWLGFDCAHHMDFSPRRGTEWGDVSASYRDVAYVRRECASLARQLVRP